MLVDGKRAIVTGAGRGIGTAIARLLAKEGARVAVHYNTSRSPAEALAAEIGGHAVQADLADPDAAARMVQEAASVLGGVDILVNNAATYAHGITYDQATWSQYQAEFAGVVGATINPTHAAVPLMVAQGSGRIVNFIATLVQRPAAGNIVHATAKSALIGYTRTLARELGPHGITVNMVSPGMTLTDFAKTQPAKIHDAVRRQTPLRRLAEAEDVARVVLFYVSPLADFVTGANIAPDGGLAVY